MKNLKLITLLAFTTLFMVQCSSNKKVADKTTDNTAKLNKDEQIVAGLHKKFTDAQISEGKVLYESSCKKCHELFAPESRDIAAWEYILPKMYVRTSLEKDEVAKLRAYLLTNAKSKG